MAESHEYRLELPAKAESVALARLFLATVLRRHGIGEGTVADAKLALSELLSVAILDPGNVEVSVTAEVTTSAVTVHIAPFPSDPSGEDLERIDIASALFPSSDDTAIRAGFAIDVAMA